MSFEQALPKSLSPSRLNDFQSCPRKYQHSSVERLPQPASYASAKGNFAHYIFEHLFKLPASERTIERAREYVSPAIDSVLTEKVREEIGLDDEKLKGLLHETEEILVTYFEMEDPREVTHEGVELRMGVTIEGAPLFGILDRLDRDKDGNLIIVDYKTGGLPNRSFDSTTFANAELYAALCKEKLGELPTTMRLLYVAHGEAVERPVTEVNIRAREKAAASAWQKINTYYNDGDFPATPSKNACRFCNFKELCRSQGVAVPS